MGKSRKNTKKNVSESVKAAVILSIYNDNDIKDSALDLKNEKSNKTGGKPVQKQNTLSSAYQMKLKEAKVSETEKNLEARTILAAEKKKKKKVTKGTKSEEQTPNKAFSAFQMKLNETNSAHVGKDSKASVHPAPEKKKKRKLSSTSLTPEVTNTEDEPLNKVVCPPCQVNTRVLNIPETEKDFETSTHPVTGKKNKRKLASTPEAAKSGDECVDIDTSKSGTLEASEKSFPNAKEDFNDRSKSSAKKRKGMKGKTESEITPKKRKSQVGTEVEEDIDVQETSGEMPDEISDVQQSLIDISTSSLSEELALKRPAAISGPDDNVILVLNHPSEVTVKGRVRVQCLVGAANVMAYSLKPGGKAVDIYSPTCNSLITIATSHGESDVTGAISEVQKACKTKENQLKKKLEEKQSFVVLIFQKIDTYMCKFITSFQPYASIFKLSGDRSTLNKMLLPLEVLLPNKNTSLPTVQAPERLCSVLENWKEDINNEASPVIAVCGGKNSGKSTTNRLLINMALNIFPSAYYLECDVGQTEFTPSGVISLVGVTSPVAGAPFCHQTEPLCAYYCGGVSPKDNPDQYLRYIAMCVEKYREQPGPLVVNTMGWLKGLGWQLLLDTVRLTSPKRIVQLTSHNKYDNVDNLTAASMTETSWSQLSQLYAGPKIPQKMTRSPIFMCIEEPLFDSYDFKLIAADYRNLSILSHLGNGLDCGMTLTSQIPYQLSWKDVCVHVCNMEVPRSQIMYALNASLIALCTADVSEGERHVEEGPVFLPPNAVCEWVGFGIVRGIDPVNKVFYITTSVSMEKLNTVNAIVKGAVTLPEHILTKQKGVKLAYADEVVSSTGIHCKKRRKRLTRQGFTSPKF